MKEVELKRKRIETDKLLPFGFVKTSRGYEYSEPVLDGFRLELTVTKEGALFLGLWKRRWTRSTFCTL